MKKIRCPKCDEPILFDDSLYTPGRTLVFECPSCRKQFKIRVGGKMLASPGTDTFGTDPEPEPLSRRSTRVSTKRIAPSR